MLCESEEFVLLLELVERDCKLPEFSLELSEDDDDDGEPDESLSVGAPGTPVVCEPLGRVVGEPDVDVGLI